MLVHVVLCEVILLNSLNAELNPSFHLLALLGAHHILHVSRIRVNVVLSNVGYFSVTLFIVDGNWVVFQFCYLYQISHWDVGVHIVYMRDVSPRLLLFAFLLDLQGLVVYMAERRGEYRICMGRLQGRDCSEDSGLDGRITWMFKK